MEFNNHTLKRAIEEWLDNPVKIEQQYGHISLWDVEAQVFISWGISLHIGFKRDHGLLIQHCQNQHAHLSTYKVSPDG